MVIRYKFSKRCAQSGKPTETHAVFARYQRSDWFAQSPSSGNGIDTALAHSLQLFSVYRKVLPTRHFREGGNPAQCLLVTWIPAFAGMTEELLLMRLCSNRFCGMGGSGEEPLRKTAMPISGKALTEFRLTIPRFAS